MTTAVHERDLDATFAALADPTRRAMLARLAAGDATVSELAEPFALTMQAVSKHIKVLEHSGLISRSRQAQTRPCHLEAAELEAAASWIDHQRRVWAERLDKLEDHLKTLQAKDFRDA